MNYLPISDHSLPGPPYHALPVTPSVTNVVTPECVWVYRFGLVRLYRRIAAKMATTLSLNCVFDIQGRLNANAHLPSTTSATITGICFTFGAGQLVAIVRSVHGFTEVSRCRRSKTPTSHRKTQRRQQPRCRNTTTDLRPSSVSARGGGGEEKLRNYLLRGSRC